MRRIALVLAFLFASVAFAQSTSELTLAARDLDGRYVDLNARIGACPAGACAAAASILSDLAALEAERAELHVEREALTPCSDCGNLDAVVQDVDLGASMAMGGTGEWGEEG